MTNLRYLFLGCHYCFKLDSQKLIMSGKMFSTRQKIRQELFIFAPNAQESSAGVASLFGSGQGYLGQSSSSNRHGVTSIFRENNISKIILIDLEKNTQRMSSLSKFARY